MQNSTTEIRWKEFYEESCKKNISPTKTVADIRLLNGKPISSLVKNGDKSEVEAFLKMHLITINAFFGSQFTDIQISISGKLLYSQYYYWSNNDWEHFSQRLMCGEYGKLFGAFSPAQLMEAAQKHDEQWMEVSMDKSIHAHAERGAIETKAVPEKVADVLQVFIDKQEEKQRLKVEKINQQVDEAKQFQSVNREKYESIRARLTFKEITEDEAVTEWNEFLNQHK